MVKVPEPHRARRLIVGLVVVVCLVLVATHFIRRERTVDGMCLLLPQVRWVLSERESGGLFSRAEDYRHGKTLHYRLYQFDRPAFVDLEIEGENQPGAQEVVYCQAGQRIAHIRSSALDIALAKMVTELAEATGLLATLRSGAKPEELDRAQLAIQLARKRLETQTLTFERHRRLHGEGILSSEEWEVTLAEQEELELAVQLAEAELQVLRSDAAPQMIAAAENTVASLENEHATLARMCQDQDIVCPVTGQVRLGGEDGTVVSVSATDTLIVRVLVPQRRGHLPHPGQRLRAYLPGLPEGPVLGEVVRVDPQVVITDAGPFLTVFGLVVNHDNRLTSGMQGRARLYCGEASLLRQIWDDLSVTFRQEMWPL